MSSSEFTDLECSPVSSIRDALDWSTGCPDSRSGRKVSRVALRKDIKRKKNNPNCKTIHCHDLKGGYLDDRFMQGTRSIDNYRFYHWHAVDLFVYFSHERFTIPPIGWINAAHRNGTPVLGTFITEWDTGTTELEWMLADDGISAAIATTMTDMALFYGFDGWLINIENKIKPDLLPKLVSFLRLLRTRLREKLPESLVLWYDSVVNRGGGGEDRSCAGHDDGCLIWQNKLNHNNKRFFDVCDGIFTNYCWTTDDLGESSLHSTDRSEDVFVGVDIFGRTPSAIGGFDVPQLVKEILSHNQSMALFAPSWTYEQLGFANFTENENKFWSAITDLTLDNVTFGLPLTWHCCQGFGTGYYWNGEMLSDEPWFDLSLQSLQSPATPAHTSLTTQHAYNGGSCVQVHQGSKFTIFSMDLNTDTSAAVLDWVVVTFAYLATAPQKGAVCRLRLANRGKPSLLIGTVDDAESAEAAAAVPEMSTQEVVRFYGEKRPRERNGWKLKFYKINRRDITTVFDVVVSAKESFYLGFIQILPDKQAPSLQTEYTSVTFGVRSTLTSVSIATSLSLQYSLIHAAEEQWAGNEQQKEVAEAFHLVGHTCTSEYLFERNKRDVGHYLVHNVDVNNLCALSSRIYKINKTK